MTLTKATLGRKHLFWLREGIVYQRKEVLVQELEVASHVYLQSWVIAHAWLAWSSKKIS